MKKKPTKKIVFVTDFGSDYKEDLKHLLLQLDGIGVELKPKQIKHKEVVWEALESDFDILFFDWGGMSLGNDMLGSQCRALTSHAEEHPSKVYIMASLFTGYAMQDALDEFLGRKMGNVIIDIQDQKDLVRAVFSEETVT